MAHIALMIALGIGLAVLPPYGVEPGAILYSSALGVTAICAWCIFSWKLIGGAIFEPYSLFLFAAICFNAGHMVLFALGADIPSSVLAQFSPETSLLTMMLVAGGLSSFHLGGLIAKNTRPGLIRSGSIANLDNRLRATRFIGLALLAISGPAWLFVTYSRIDRVIQYGYFLASFGTTVSTGFTHLPELLAEALAPGLVFLLAGSKFNPALRRGTWVAILVFAAATLFTGSKGPAVMALLAFTWVWHRSIRPLRGPLLLFGALVLTVVVIPLTTAVREIAGRDRASLAVVADAYADIGNPAVAFLSETGWTANTIAHTTELVPTVRDYDYGRSYGYAALAVLPNVIGGLHPAKERGFLADWLVSSLAPEYAARGGGWGFSFLAEAYANFGLYGGLIALMFIGYLLGKLLGWAQWLDDPARTAMIGACLCSGLLYARGESALLLRGLVWYAIIPYLCLGRLATRLDSQDAKTLGIRLASASLQQSCGG